jgi:hypothetical protein
VTDKIPNPRANKRKREMIEIVQRQTLDALQFFCFALAFLILATVSQ